MELKISLLLIYCSFHKKRFLFTFSFLQIEISFIKKSNLEIKYFLILIFFLLLLFYYFEEVNYDLLNIDKSIGVLGFHLYIDKKHP